MGHLLLRCLVNVHDCLLADDDLCRIGLRLAGLRSYRRRIRLHDDTANGVDRKKAGSWFTVDGRNEVKGSLR